MAIGDTNMTKIEQLEELFQEWRKSSPDDFFEDGIMCEEEWDHVETRVLFILKEVNETNKSAKPWRLPALFGDYYTESIWKKDLRPTWENIYIWLKGILNGKHNYYMSENTAVDYEEIRSTIKKCAVMNIKKTRGGSTADLREIIAYARRNRDNILKEINIINPHVIICCGTFDIMYELLSKSCSLKPLPTGDLCLVSEIDGHDYTFFRQNHPNSRSIRRFHQYNLLIQNLMAAHVHGIIDIKSFHRIDERILAYWN
jgi:hypothetical protein